MLNDEILPHTVHAHSVFLHQPRSDEAHELVRHFHWAGARERAIGRSADFQSAVSPNSIRQAARPLGDAGGFQGWRIGNPRYSRLEICATKPRPTRAKQIPPSDGGEGRGEEELFWFAIVAGQDQSAN